jgi:hypothetical protein
MADQSERIFRHVQPTHYLSQSWLAGRFLSFSVVRLVIFYLQLTYKFVIEAHESSHVTEELIRFFYFIIDVLNSWYHFSTGVGCSTVLMHPQSGAEQAICSE